MTTEAQLGLIGGTMGLLTGFSILSGVEIVYYLLKLVFSLRAPWALVSNVYVMFEKCFRKGSVGASSGAWATRATSVIVSPACPGGRHIHYLTVFTFLDFHTFSLKSANF